MSRPAASLPEILQLPQMPQGLQQVMNLGQLLTQTARKYPALPGFIQGDLCCSWACINARVDALAHYLKSLGIRPGDRVLVQLTNGLPLFESAWATFKLGGGVGARQLPADIA